jgi:hypothetical protein
MKFAKNIFLRCINEHCRLPCKTNEDCEKEEICKEGICISPQNPDIPQEDGGMDDENKQDTPSSVNEYNSGSIIGGCNYTNLLSNYASLGIQDWIIIFILIFLCLNQRTSSIDYIIIQAKRS